MGPNADLPDLDVTEKPIVRYNSVETSSGAIYHDAYVPEAPLSEAEVLARTDVSALMQDSREHAEPAAPTPTSSASARTAAAALTEVLWRYGQSHTADGELTWDARLSADASADCERDGG